MTAVILLGHGSRDPRASDAVRNFAETLPEHGIHHSVRAAFLDHNRPTLQEVVDSLPVGDREVIVVPMLLSSAFHAKTDVPAAIRELKTTRNVRTTAPVGSVSALAESAASTFEGPLVLGFSGTSDPLAQADLDALAASLAAKRGTPVIVGYATQAQPDVASAIKQINATGVITYTLWPGMFTDLIRQAAADAGIPSSPSLHLNALLYSAVLEVIANL